MATGAPVNNSDRDNETHWRTPPRWTNPCGLNEADKQAMSNLEHEPQNVEALLVAAVRQMGTALHTVRETKKEFVSESWKGKTSENIHRMLAHENYEWLPNLPKRWGEDVSGEHLENLELNDTLLNIYKYLQMVAVGLEQVVIDMRVHGSSLIKNFEAAEHQLTLVLCEIQTLLYYQKVDHRKHDIQRDHMGDEFRELDATQRKSRDWIILREYMNTLEYAQQVLSHMRARDS